MNRFRAACTHLGISAVIAALIVGLMLRFWYPPPYFDAMGGEVLILLLAGCDVVIGPLITLIIFKPKKRGLKMDLTIIGLVQVAALAYGSHTMFIARPVFTVFAVDRFDVVPANEIRAADLAEGKQPEFRALSLTGPVLAGIALPSEPVARQEITMGGYKYGKDIAARPELYLPYEQTAAEAARKAKPITMLARRNEEAATRIRELERSAGKREEQLAYLPLSARNQDMSVVIDAANGQIVGILPIVPW
jgi:hypothetical protein